MRMSLKKLIQNGFRDSIEHEIFISKKNRDERCDELKKLYSGEPNIYFRKTTISNQRLHPMYIKDSNQNYDTNFGNDDYINFYEKLYKIEKWIK